MSSQAKVNPGAFLGIRTLKVLLKTKLMKVKNEFEFQRDFSIPEGRQQLKLHSVHDRIRLSEVKK